MSPCGLVTEPGVYKYDGAVECRGAHDKNVFNRKEIFIFQSTFLAVIQSWPVRPLVVISKPRTRHQAGPSQQPQARPLKVSTKIRGNFHNILRPPYFEFGTLHLRIFAVKTPVLVLWTSVLISGWGTVWTLVDNSVLIDSWALVGTFNKKKVVVGAFHWYCVPRNFVDTFSS